MPKCNELNANKFVTALEKSERFAKCDLCQGELSNKEFVIIQDNENLIGGGLLRVCKHCIEYAIDVCSPAE